MALVNYLAEVWGIAMVIISLALLVNERHLKRIFASIENDESLFLWGFISFIIGISMVLAYNVWAESWQVIITILGWLALIKGAALLFMPGLIKKWAKKLEAASILPYALVIMVIIGLVVTYYGFTA